MDPYPNTRVTDLQALHAQISGAQTLAAYLRDQISPSREAYNMLDDIAMGLHRLRDDAHCVLREVIAPAVGDDELREEAACDRADYVREMGL